MLDFDLHNLINLGVNFQLIDEKSFDLLTENFLFKRLSNTSKYTDVVCNKFVFFADYSKNLFVKFILNPKKFPKLSFDKLNQNLVLFYNGPKDLGQLSFSFEYDELILAFNQKKFKHDTPKLYYSDFVSSFQSFFIQPFNPFLKLVLSCFSLTPTVAKKAVHQNKNIKRKITLYPKMISVFKLFT